MGVVCLKVLHRKNRAKGNRQGIGEDPVEARTSFDVYARKRGNAHQESPPSLARASF